MWSSLKRNVEQGTLLPNESESHGLFKLMNMCSLNTPTVHNYNVFSLPHFLSNCNQIWSQLLFFIISKVWRGYSILRETSTMHKECYRIWQDEHTELKYGNQKLEETLEFFKYKQCQVNSPPPMQLFSTPGLTFV